MNHTDSAQRLIRELQLQPHPEGGYYRETYRSVQAVSVEAGQRSASTAIYYLLQGGDYSAWHRIASDELWHFYAGSSLQIHVMDTQGCLVTHRLGNPLQDAAAVFQVVVPAGHWFAAELAEPVPHEAGHTPGARFALVGCTVAPGFEFSEFELADTVDLSARYPEHASLLRRLGSAEP